MSNQIVSDFQPAEYGNNSFVKLMRTRETEELMRDTNAFMVLILVALRARRTDTFNVDDLQPGEALLGDFEKIGLTRQNYRTALKNLKKWKFLTTKVTTKGTVATLINTDVVDINIGDPNHQTNQRLTIDQPTANHRLTTNKNVKNVKNVKNKNTHTQKIEIETTLQKWIADELKNVSGMRDQLTAEQSEKITGEFSKFLIHEKLMAMDNKPDLQKKYVSVYLTLRNWCALAMQKGWQEPSRAKVIDITGAGTNPFFNAAMNYGYDE